MKKAYDPPGDQNALVFLLDQATRVPHGSHMEDIPPVSRAAHVLSPPTSSSFFPTRSSPEHPNIDATHLKNAATSGLAALHSGGCPHPLRLRGSPPSAPVAHPLPLPPPSFLHGPLLQQGPWHDGRCCHPRPPLLLSATSVTPIAASDARRCSWRRPALLLSAPVVAAIEGRRCCHRRPSLLPSAAAVAVVRAPPLLSSTAAVALLLPEASAR
jgi:hypothetical protein